MSARSTARCRRRPSPRRRRCSVTQPPPRRPVTAPTRPAPPRHVRPPPYFHKTVFVLNPAHDFQLARYPAGLPSVENNQSGAHLENQCFLDGAAVMEMQWTGPASFLQAVHESRAKRNADVAAYEPARRAPCSSAYSPERICGTSGTFQGWGLTQQRMQTSRQSERRGREEGLPRRCNGVHGL